MAHASMATVIPGKLYWAPMRARPPKGFEGEFIMAAELCSYGEEEFGLATKYRVTHYSSRTPWRTFGPLGLDVLLRFCRALSVRESDASVAGIAIGTEPGDENHRANMAVMFGAHLILQHSWDVQELSKVFGQSDAELLFACSWSRSDRPEPARNMSVRDCWAGIALAARMGWLSSACLDSDERAFSLCRLWQRGIKTYDCSWLVPGYILVGADPSTTAADPNPGTVHEVFPTDTALTRTPSTASSCGESETHPQSLSAAGGEYLKLDVAEAACTEYGAALLGQSQAADGGKPAGRRATDFATFLRESGVSTVVRMNYETERGMPEGGGYDPERFRDYGFQHFDLLMADRGTVALTKGDLRRALESLPDPTPEGNAVFVHCKAGFGRSAVLACCLAVERLDVPGAALLGLIRILRPGSVNTPQQELLLKSFVRRNDVRRFVGLPVVDEGAKDASGMKCGCVMQ